MEGKALQANSRHILEEIWDSLTLRAYGILWDDIWNYLVGNLGFLRLDRDFLGGKLCWKYEIL